MWQTFSSARSKSAGKPVSGPSRRIESERLNRARLLETGLRRRGIPGIERQNQADRGTRTTWQASSSSPSGSSSGHLRRL